jgi:hypothetical protein
MNINRLPLACTFLALACLVSSVRAVTLLADNADWTVLGQYNTVVPNGSATPANFPANGSLNFAGWTAYNGPGALTPGTYQASFGYSDGYTNPTYWAPNTTLKLQTTIDLSGNDLSSIQFNLAIDNDLELFLNGIQVNLSGLTYNELPGGGGEYYRDGQPLPVSGFLPSQDLQAGVNTIDVIAVDRGGGTYFDMNITGAADTPSVPDSGNSALLLAGSCVCLALAYQRVRRFERV